jgi:ethanolamine utilization protein EutQ
MDKRVYAKAEIEKTKAEGKTVLKLEPGDVLTPLARDTALELGVTIVEPGETAPAAAAPAAISSDKVEEIVKAVLGRLTTEEKKEECRTCTGQFGALRPCPTPLVYGTRPGALKLVEMPKVGQLPPSELRDKAGNLLTPPEIDFRLQDVVTMDDASSMGGGYMSWLKGGFEWHLTYDEIDCVVQGIMEITCEGRTLTAGPGDLVFIPAGSKVRWSTPSWALVYYVTFPANWFEQ